MKYLLTLLFLSSCIVVARPIDIIGGRPYCEPVHQDVWQCRDDRMRPWRCVWRGHWRCWRD